MATLSECTRRWRKKRLLVLLSNNYANKKTPSYVKSILPCRLRKQRRFAIVNFKLVFLETTFRANDTDDIFSTP
eukprot:scaffold286960_cov88-Attheya_sp.AAC.1